MGTLLLGRVQDGWKEWLEDPCGYFPFAALCMFTLLAENQSDNEAAV